MATTTSTARREASAAVRGRPCHHYARGACRFGDRCRHAHLGPVSSQGAGRKRGCEDLVPPQRASGGLLAKLLAKDVVREQATVLQALRFICANNLFLDTPLDADPSRDLVFPEGVGDAQGAGGLARAPDAKQGLQALLQQAKDEDNEENGHDDGHDDDGHDDDGMDKDAAGVEA